MDVGPLSICNVILVGSVSREALLVLTWYGMATEMGSSRLELNPRREGCSLHRQRTEGPEARQAPLLFL